MSYIIYEAEYLFKGDKATRKKENFDNQTNRSDKETKIHFFREKYRIYPLVLLMTPRAVLLK